MDSNDTSSLGESGPHNALLRCIQELCTEIELAATSEDHWAQLAQRADDLMVRVVNSDISALLDTESAEGLENITVLHNHTVALLAQSMNRVRERIEHLNEQRLSDTSAPRLVDVEG